MSERRPPRALEALVARLLPAAEREPVVGDLREDYAAWARTHPLPLLIVRYVGVGLSVAVHYFAAGLLSGRGGWGDVRVAARRLRRAPGFTLLAMSAIAIGIGANAVMLGVAAGVFLSPLPFPESDRLGLITYDFTGSESDNFGVGYRDLEELGRASTTLDRVSPVLDWMFVDLTGEGEASRLSAAFLGPGYLELLGVEPVLGRVFTEDENRPGAGTATALLSRSYWQESLGGDPRILGRTLNLNGITVEVVGVLPGEAHDLRQRFDRMADVYLPLHVADRVLAQADLFEDRGPGALNALVRLRAGASFVEARADLAAVSARLEAEHPDTNEGWSFHVDPLEEVFYGEVRTPIVLLIAGAVLVFLLVAFDLTGLLLVRAMGRRHEAAVRRSLGAVPGRVLRLSLIESVLLATGGLVAAVVLARVGIGLLEASSLLALPSFASLRLGPGVVAVTVLSAAVLALLLGLASWAPTALVEPSTVLEEGRRSTTGLGGRRIRGALVIGEVGVAFALLVVCGLLVRSFEELRTVDMGFETERLLTLKLELRGDRYASEDAQRAAALDLVARAEGVPGVEAAFLWSPHGIWEGSWVDLLTREGRWDLFPAERLEASRHHVLPGTFATAGMRLIRGRDFAASDDAASPDVAIVSESLADRLWPGQDPIGQALESRPGGELRVRRVIGVVEDARHRSRFADPFGPQLDIYHAFAQWPQRNLSVAARVSPGADVASLAAALRAGVGELDPTLPTYDLATMEERLTEEETRARLTTWMVAAFALVATLLASLGIYGVLAQSVRDRTREIGVRIALGAERRSLVGAVALQGVTALLPGALLGASIVWSAAGLVEGALYGVSMWDAWVFAWAVAVLLIVGAASSLLPALRASRISPVEALSE